MSQKGVILCTRGVTRVETSIVREALRFIFRSDNSQMLSWGTISIKHSSGVVVFPSVFCRNSQHQLYHDYVYYNSALSVVEGNPTVECTIFQQMAVFLTRAQHKRKSSIYYMLGGLVYENVANIDRLVYKEVSDGLVHQLLKLWLNLRL